MSRIYQKAWQEKLDTAWLATQKLLAQHKTGTEHIFLCGRLDALSELTVDLTANLQPKK